ncbi:hypothetical protein HK097_005626 [Rhizophlyctis rosea]|uniref:Uncharacterized protein n=1 Tax=Rhizophlyctis rosea TaxID=64517 RepID=A0AAD5X6S1_9FUNG|nr:hypothetical protein HK097_005626 [Rhizophlyctis rosea]
MAAANARFIPWRQKAIEYFKSNSDYIADLFVRNFPIAEMQKRMKREAKEDFKKYEANPTVMDDFPLPGWTKEEVKAKALFQQPGIMQLPMSFDTWWDRVNVKLPPSPTSVGKGKASKRASDDAPVPVIAKYPKTNEEAFHHAPSSYYAGDADAGMDQDHLGFATPTPKARQPDNNQRSHNFQRLHNTQRPGNSDYQTGHPQNGYPARAFAEDEQPESTSEIPIQADHDANFFDNPFASQFQSKANGWFNGTEYDADEEQQEQGEGRCDGLNHAQEGQENNIVQRFNEVVRRLNLLLMDKQREIGTLMRKLQESEQNRAILKHQLDIEVARITFRMAETRILLKGESGRDEAIVDRNLAIRRAEAAEKALEHEQQLRVTAERVATHLKGRVEYYKRGWKQIEERYFAVGSEVAAVAT